MRGETIQKKNIRIIKAEALKNAIIPICIKANIDLRQDVTEALRRALRLETKKLPKDILKAIIYNSIVAREKKLAICQDTGLPLVFLEIGQDVHVEGDLNQAVNDGIKEGYEKGFLRNSIIQNPLLREKSGYSPAIIHIDIVRGRRLKITVLPKGFGCENKSQLKMFNPTADLVEIKDFIIKAARDAGPDACPPYIIGVGIGGTADYACLLAKKALLRNIVHSPQSTVYRLEQDLLNKINRLNIGPMGFGGKATCLAVNIESHPTHIAGLPVAVNISCHALRSAAKTL